MLQTTPSLGSCRTVVRTFWKGRPAVRRTKSTTTKPTMTAQKKRTPIRNFTWKMLVEVAKLKAVTKPKKRWRVKQKNEHLPKTTEPA